MKKTLSYLFALGVFAISLATLSSCQSTNQESKENATVNNAIKSAKAQLENMKITVVSSPKETTKGAPFASPYKIQVTTLDGEPYASLAIIAEYPSSRTDSSISLAHQEIVTNENGQATFTPPTPQFAVNSNVYFYPKTTSSNPQIMKLCTELTVSSPWKVRTSASAKTGILVSIVDYDQNGKISNTGGAQLSTQALLKVLWRSGLTGAQNAEFNSAIDADSPARIQKDAIALLNGNTRFTYVIYGRVKYASKVTQDEDGFYNVTLNGEMGVLNINTGEVLLKTSKTISTKDKTQWKLMSLAQEEMAKEFGEELIYGL